MKPNPSYKLAFEALGVKAIRIYQYVPNESDEIFFISDWSLKDYRQVKEYVSEVLKGLPFKVLPLPSERLIFVNRYKIVTKRKKSERYLILRNDSRNISK